jgi:hypothetical protein
VCRSGRHVDGGVPQQFLGELQVPGLRVDEACSGMPERMETRRPWCSWDAKSIQRWVEHVLSQNIRVQWRSRWGQEDEVVGALPKRTDLSGYAQSDLDKIALRLNQRPRKTLGFQTPASKLRASVATTH